MTLEVSRKIERINIYIPLFRPKMARKQVILTYNMVKLQLLENTLVLLKHGKIGNIGVHLEWITLRFTYTQLICVCLPKII